MITFLMFLIYGAAAVVSLIFLILFLFGRLLGGVLDETSAPASRIADEAARVAAVQALTPPTTWFGRVGRVLNTMGDNLQRAAGLGLFFSLLIMGAFAGIIWWTTGDHLFIAVVAALGAGNMLYYLSAAPAERAKRAIFVSTMLTGIVIAALIIQVGFKNNAEWYQPQFIVAHVEMDGKTETFPVLTTPNGTYLDLERLVGGDANRVNGIKKGNVMLVSCLPGLNPDLAGYELRCHEAVMELRAQRAKPHSWNMAAGEYSSVEALGLARKALATDVAQQHAVLAAQADRVAQGKIPLVSRFSDAEIASLILAILLSIGLLAYAQKVRTPAGTTPTGSSAFLGPFAQWTGIAFLAFTVLYVIARFLEGASFSVPDLPTASEGSQWMVLAVASAVGLVVLLVLASAKKWDTKWPLMLVVVLLVGLTWYGFSRHNTRTERQVTVVSLPPPDTSTPVEVKETAVPDEAPIKFAPIKVSAARHAKMCAILDPVEDAEPRRLARCP